MQDTPRRLGWVALLYAGCYTLAHTVGSTSGFYEALGFSPAHGTAAAAILVSLLVFWISRSRLLSSESTNDLGLLYQVVGAFGIDAYLSWIPIDQSFLPVGISWVGVWIVCFVVIVPSTPGKTLLASLAAASATPLLLLVGMARGTADPSVTAIVQLCFPNYVCAVVAVAGSHIIYQLRSEVAEARQLGSYKLTELLGQGGMGEVLAGHASDAGPTCRHQADQPRADRTLPGGFVYAVPAVPGGSKGNCQSLREILSHKNRCQIHPR